VETVVPRPTLQALRWKQPPYAHLCLFNFFIKIKEILTLLKFNSLPAEREKVLQSIRKKM
jgi:hypothetical protein